MPTKDPYNLLGLTKDATDAEIKKAYRKLAHKYHPDKGGTKDDEAKFREVNEAYQILSDPQKRSRYDQFGAAGFGAGDGGAGGGPGGAGFEGFSGFGGGQGQAGQGAQGFGFEGFGDIFEQFFSGGAQAAQRGPARGADMEVRLNLEFAEAVNGFNKQVSVNRRVKCATCSGNGAEPGTKIITCPRCDGAGEIRITRQTILGTMAQVAVCPECRGEGKKPAKPCHTCAGEGRVQQTETVDINIPAGIDDGQTIRVQEQGEVGERGAPSGHLYVTVRVKPSKVFQRDGADVKLTAPITYPQAVLGAEIEVPTLHGRTTLKVPAGTESGKTFRVKGEGIQQLQGGGKGDELVTVEIVVPNKLNSEERRLMEQLAAAGGQGAATKKSWFDKLGL